MYTALPYDACDDKCIFIDVRSESEFEKGHIINAINLPILNNLERHEVGWIYKNSSVEEAKRVGLKHGSNKLHLFFETVDTIVKEHPDHKIVFYCARGGYRSRSIALLMQGIDLPVHWLQGGYKAYRKIVLDLLNNPDALPEFIVLNGYTGVGKTHVLESLKALGMDILDLEAAANHKGSHLGSIGTDRSQSVQLFENSIFHQLLNNNSGYCFVESESKRIGKVYVPGAVFDKLQRGLYIKLEASMEFRIKGLIKDYVEAPDFLNSFESALMRIKPYIGQMLYNEMLSYFKSGNYEELAHLLLDKHYDPIYLKSIQSHDHAQIFLVSSFDKCAKEIRTWFNHSILSQ
jgi:tRNA 2-selenouridine synthase